MPTHVVLPQLLKRHFSHIWWWDGNFRSERKQRGCTKYSRWQMLVTKKKRARRASVQMQCVKNGLFSLWPGSDKISKYYNQAWQSVLFTSTGWDGGISSGAWQQYSCRLSNPSAAWITEIKLTSFSTELVFCMSSVTTTTLGLDLVNASSYVSQVHLEIKMPQFCTYSTSNWTIKMRPNIISSPLNLTPSFNCIYFWPSLKEVAKCAGLFPTVVTARSWTCGAA